MGFPGAAHDARVLQNSGIYNLIGSQGRQVLFYENKYHLLGDSSYPLRDWLITPFRRLPNISQNQLRFNHKLSATRCVIENCFGLLKGPWRRVQETIDVKKIEHGTDIVMAWCILHNFCLTEGDIMDLPIPTVNEVYVDNNDGTASGEYKRNEVLRAVVIRKFLNLWPKLYFTFVNYLVCNICV